MKKTLVFLLAGILGIFLLTGCLTKEKVVEDEGEKISNEATTTVFSLSSIKEEIKENYEKKTEGWDTGSPDFVPLKKVSDVIVVYDGSKYGYVYGVTNDGTGMYFKVDKALEISLKDTFEATGRPYYTERDKDNGYFEYRFTTTQDDAEIKITKNNVEIPWDKAEILTVNNLPGMNNIGNLVVFEGKYLKKDDHGNFEFDLNDDGKSDVLIVSYCSSILDDAGVQVGNKYEIKGVIGYNYGFKVFVGDASFITKK
ncbi:hypothetical protein Marpi_0737 [Marinitoga piezophila KA3]|uniref:Lipoprotein n=1 Tax=Marinitoga piezophila (strain DSM 14283 / JCM 11233 / KA3) TaxID=443254 RepID=H2J6I2_MARPK|nr:hypothetical protein [Marinitoga piezophila]AEX85167.1 hypothetical protein Marpi_0737 [Marinitoga piezophila KA3]